MREIIYRLSFDFQYDFADIAESFNGASSLDLTSETPNLLNFFKYDWKASESNIKPNFVIINSELLGCEKTLFKGLSDKILGLRLYPIRIVDDEYLIFTNIQTIPNCINIKKSKVIRFSNGDIMEISSPVFMPDNYPILFKVEEIPSSIFCNHEFKDYITKNSYSGLLFKECPIKSKSWI